MLLWFLCSGCSHFSVTQTDDSPGERTIRTRIAGTAVFSSAQHIAKIRATMTDKTQSFGSEGLGQQGATNMVDALKSIDSILGKLRP